MDDARRISPLVVDDTTAVEARPSTGLSLLLTLPPNKSSPPVLYTNYTDEAYPVYAWSQGSFSFLPNGNTFMGYGAYGVMIEYGPP